MRRFEILRDGTKVGEGVEWSDGTVNLHIDRDGRMAPSFGSVQCARDVCELREAEGTRFLDFPPAAPTSDGTPVYTPPEPPPPAPVEQTGKLPSERIMDLAEEDGVAMPEGGKLVTVNWRHVAEYLDERLGRG